MKTRTVFDIVAPEYSSISEDKFTTVVELAGGRLSAKEWGGNYQKAACLLAAHILAMGDRAANTGAAGGPSGPVAGLSEDGQSIDFGGSSGKATTAGEAALEATSYGQRFNTLRDETISGPIMSGDED